jgi:two-component sensor histidine kinase
MRNLGRFNDRRPPTNFAEGFRRRGLDVLKSGREPGIDCHRARDQRREACVSGQACAGHVLVGYEVDGTNWKLSVSDNGIGMPDRTTLGKRIGLGTSLLTALSQHLEAQVEIASTSKGTTVSITHATFISRLPAAA